MTTKSTDSKYLYGFYSARAEMFVGSVIWETPDGKWQEVTAVLETESGEGYYWPDKVYVGPVVKFVKAHRPQRWTHV